MADSGVPFLMYMPVCPVCWGGPTSVGSRVAWCWHWNGENVQDTLWRGTLKEAMSAGIVLELLWEFNISGDLWDEF